MPRRAEPFPHQGYFKTSFGGRQRILCRIEDGIEAAREELRTSTPKFRTGRLSPDMTVARPPPFFLREKESDKGSEHRTFTGYRRNLQRFVERLGPRKLRSLTAGDGVEYKRFLRDDARTKITGRRPGQKLGNVRPPQPLGTVTINHHLRAAKAVLNWAVDNDLLVKSPWRKNKVKLLTENSRKRVITPEEFDRLLQACLGDQVFQDILWVMRLTAARPEDIRHLTWDMMKWSALLIHEPGDDVSFGDLPLGLAAFEDAFHLVPQGLEVTQARPQRCFQVCQGIEQAVVRRPSPQLLPKSFDRIQLRTVARQSLEFQVRVVFQRLVNGLAAMPRGVVDHQHDLRIVLLWIHATDVPQVSREGFLEPSRFALARAFLGVLGALQRVRMHRRRDQIHDREDVQQILVVARAHRRPVTLDPERGRQRRHHGEAGLVLAQQDEFTGRGAFPNAARSSFACACLTGSPRK